MDLFVSSESTRGVVFSDLRELIRIEDIFNTLTTRNNIKEIKKIALIYVIVNPSVAEPFPEEVILRKNKAMLDLRVRINFEKWSGVSGIDKVILAIDTVIDFISNLKSDTVSNKMKSEIVALFKEVKLLI